MKNTKLYEQILGLEASWSGSPYMKLQKTTSLMNPDWQDVAGSHGVSSMDLPATDRSAFFRLVKP